ncbi:hypothetical protein EON83_00170 [bacterium]|nr:MAG: hypothetical protein EON83_00170 [bacterium]
MSFPARPEPLQRPQALQRPASFQRTGSADAARRLRVSNAFRAYLVARYEWLRLRAIGAGYVTNGGHTPLPLKGDEKISSIQERTQTLLEWLNHNAPAEVEMEEAPEVAPVTGATGREAAPHVRQFLDLATKMGLSHEKGHRAARLGKINAFLMDNERAPIEALRDMREEDCDLLETGLRKRVLRWP